MHSEIDYRSNKTVVFSVLSLRLNVIEVFSQTKHVINFSCEIESFFVSHFSHNLSQPQTKTFSLNFHSHSWSHQKAQTTPNFVCYLRFCFVFCGQHIQLPLTTRNKQNFPRVFSSAELVTWKLLRLWFAIWKVKSWSLGRRRKSEDAVDCCEKKTDEMSVVTILSNCKQELKTDTPTWVSIKF